MFDPFYSANPPHNPHDQPNPWKEKILFSGILRHPTGIRQSMAWRATLQDQKDPTPSILLHLKILAKSKAIKGKTKKILLAHGPTLQTKHTEQNNPLQGRNKTCLDLRNPTMGNSK